MLSIIFVLLGLWGCAEQQQDEQEQQEEEIPTCIEMTRSQCMMSSLCTLELTDTNAVYSCRDAAGVCEEGVVQNDIMGNTSGNIDCRTIEGCEITGGECYCSCPGYGQTAVEDEASLEECNCMCGGEEPTSCTPVE